MTEPVDRHAPVLVDEVITALAPRPGGIYMDCTFGRGGHTRALLERVGASGRVLVLDKDPAAAAGARALAERDRRVRARRGSFTGLEGFAREEGVWGRLDGVLFDLGVSSPQLDDPARGFSFRAEGPLDMRMDPERGESAAGWLARAGEGEIARVLKRYGEERYARRIARAIVAARRERPIETTRQLAEIVARAAPTRERERHPATRTFQALRIVVNDELEELAEALDQALRTLAPGGRLAVISFHSLEDRLVKRFMRRPAGTGAAPRGLPLPGEPAPPPLRPLGKPVRPTEAEVARNPRARSAMLRVAEKRREGGDG